VSKFKGVSIDAVFELMERQQPRRAVITAGKVTVRSRAQLLTRRPVI
jgi:hypothetical protein